MNDNIIQISVTIVDKGLLYRRPYLALSSVRQLPELMITTLRHRKYKDYVYGRC